MLQTIYIVHCRSEKVIKVVKIISRENNTINVFHPTLIVKSRSVYQYNYFFEKKQLKFRFPIEPIRDTQNSNWNFFRKKFETFTYLPKRASVNVIQIHRARDSTVGKLEKKKKEIRQKIR